MKLEFIRDLYEKGLVYVCEEFDDWKEAVVTSCKPLIDHGYCEQGYADGIIAHVEHFGPYIFLAPHLCMPHCKAYEFVHKPGVAFMKVNKPVISNPEEPEMGAELFFPLCAMDEGAHVDAISELAEVFDDEETLDALIACKNDADFRKLLGIK